jgi:antitoxin MazE
LPVSRFVTTGLVPAVHGTAPRIDGTGFTYTLGRHSPEVAMQVSRWGNSLAVRLPATVVEALGLKEGDEIEIHVVGDRSFGVARDDRRTRALERIRAFRRPLPAGWKFDREEDSAR